MKDEVQSELLKHIEKVVRSGFDTEIEIYNDTLLNFPPEYKIDEAWLLANISTRFDQHQRESKQWERPTDFDKLAEVFDALIEERIISLHRSGVKKADAIIDANEITEKLEEYGFEVKGYCYYHDQDLETAVDPNVRTLYIGFDARLEGSEDGVVIGQAIVDKLRDKGFRVKWPGTITERILIENIDWKKVPDNENWHFDRAIEKLMGDSYLT